MDWMHILSIAARVLLVVLLVGLVIFVHELGHFLAARRLGLVVDVFSLGFGPAIWKRKIGDVVYKISVVPLGGYVAIPQLDPSGMETVQGENKPDSGGKEEEKPRELPSVAPWKRIVVAIAGPLGNVALAVVLAFWIYLAPQAVTGNVGAEISTVETNSPAWLAGLRPQQVIKQVNGKKVDNWLEFEVECYLVGDPARGVTLTVLDGGQKRDLPVALTIETNAVINLGYISGVEPKGTCRVSGFPPHSVAEAGGMKIGDTLLRSGGVPIVGIQQFKDCLKLNGTNSVCIDLDRGGRRLALTLAPRMDEVEARPMIGVELRDPVQAIPPWMMYREPWKQIQTDASQVVRLLQALIFPKHKGESQRAANSVGGMPSIVAVLWDAIKSGFFNTLGLLRMIGINLAIINLLPIPVLDGGHVMFALLETITRRKPNPKVMSVVVNFFAVLLIGLMLLLIVRDPIVRLWTSEHWPFKPAAAQAAAPVTNGVPAAAGTNAASGGAAP